MRLRCASAWERLVRCARRLAMFFFAGALAHRNFHAPIILDCLSQTYSEKQACSGKDSFSLLKPFLFMPPRPPRPEGVNKRACSHKNSGSRLNLVLFTPPRPSRPFRMLARPLRPEGDLVHAKLCLFTPPRPSRPEGVNKQTCCASKKSVVVFDAPYRT